MNGLTRRFSETTQPAVERIFLSTLVGILLGIFVLVIFNAPTKFIFYLVLGPTILFIATISGKFKRFFQGALILIIPFNYYTHFFRRPGPWGTAGLDFSPLDIILFLLYIIWIYELLLKRSKNLQFFPKITIPALGLVAICLLSMIPAQDKYLAFFEALLIFRSILLYIYIANHVQSKRDIYFILALLLIGLFLESLIGFAQKWLGLASDPRLFGEKRETPTFVINYYITTARVWGTIGGPNALAKYVELLIPISLMLLFCRIKLRYKLMNALVFSCALIVLLLTLSRGGWVCFAGSIGLALLLMVRVKLLNLRTLVAFTVVVLIFAGVILSFSGMVTNRLFGEDYGAAEGRLPLNRTALKIIKSHPVLGVGSKNYWLVMDFYNPNLENVAPFIVHNAYLLKAAEMGIPGLIIFLWLLSAIFLRGLQNFRLKDRSLIPINIGILAGMAALWAHWMVDPAYIGDWAVFWIGTGLVAGSRKCSEQR